MNRKIGIVGIPPLAVIRRINSDRDQIIDLDEPQLQIAIDLSAQYLPRVYCAILRTVVLNAMHLDLDRIYIDVGPATIPPFSGELDGVLISHPVFGSGIKNSE